MLHVFRLHFQENQNIIKINKEELFSLSRSTSLTSFRLEHCEGVCESEWHPPVLKVSDQGLKSRLPFVPTADVYEMVGVGDVVEAMVIDARSQRGCLSSL